MVRQTGVRPTEGQTDRQRDRDSDRQVVPYCRGSRQREVPSSMVVFWQMSQMLKNMKTGSAVKAVTPSQASMKTYVSRMNFNTEKPII